MADQVLHDPIGVRRDNLAGQAVRFDQVLERNDVVPFALDGEQKFLRDFPEPTPLRYVQVEGQDDPSAHKPATVERLNKLDELVICPNCFACGIPSCVLHAPELGHERHDEMQLVSRPRFVEEVTEGTQCFVEIGLIRLHPF